MSRVCLARIYAFNSQQRSDFTCTDSKTKWVQHKKQYRKVDTRELIAVHLTVACISQGIHLSGYHRRMPLIGVSLRGVHLTDMHLIGIYLTGMHLTGVHLAGVHLVGVSLDTFLNF